MKKLILLLSCLLFFVSTAGHTQQNKVVIVPLSSSKAPTCTIRKSDPTSFDSGSFLHLSQDCNSDEIAVSGGFGIAQWSATNECYVYRNEPNDTNGWRTSWASPTGNGCSGTFKNVYVSVVCCKW